MRYRFRGNPRTNDAARYGDAMRRFRDAMAIWQRNGCIGPKPVQPPRPASLEPDALARPNAETESAAERRRRINAENERKRRKLF